MFAEMFFLIKDYDVKLQKGMRNEEINEEMISCTISDGLDSKLSIRKSAEIWFQASNSRIMD